MVVPVRGDKLLRKSTFLRYGFQSSPPTAPAIIWLMTLPDQRSTRPPSISAGSLRANNFERALATLIAAIPFISAPILNWRIGDIPGLKIPNLLAAFAFLMFASHGISWPKDAIGRRALIGFGCYCGLFLFAFLRSLPHLQTFHALFPDTFSGSPIDYVDSNFALPILFAMTFLYLIVAMRSERRISLVVDAISISMCVLSVSIVVLVAYEPSAFFASDRSAILDLIASSFGLHYNGLATFYTITGPLLLFLGIRRGGFSTFNFFLAFAAVILLKSRTAIVIFAASSVATVIALGRFRSLLVAGPAITFAAIILAGPVLIQLLSTGFTQKSGISLFLLLSGREQAIWIPLLFEWFRDPSHLYFGEGLFGILTSKILFSPASLFAAGQAHNLYLEFFLDNGAVLTVGFLVALVYGLLRGWALRRRVNSQLYVVLYICIASFLVSGLTGRRFFPDGENLLVFPMLALMLNVARLKLVEAPRNGHEISRA